MTLAIRHKCSRTKLLQLNLNIAAAEEATTAMMSLKPLFGFCAL